MPLYEYACRGCREIFEVLQRVGEDARGLVCPRCGGRQLDKEHSTFAASGSPSRGGCAPGRAFT